MATENHPSEQHSQQNGENNTLKNDFETSDTELAHHSSKDEDAEQSDHTNDASHETQRTTISVHPLNRKWCLYYSTPAEKKGGAAKTSEQWQEAVRKVATVETVEQFWMLYNSVRAPTKLTAGSSYWFFEDGISPAWEDPAFKTGGQWRFSFRRETSDDDVNKAWLEALLSLIGEWMEYGEDVAGVMIKQQPNKPARADFWTKSANDERKQMNIARDLRKILSLDTKERLVYSKFNSKGETLNA